MQMKTLNEEELEEYNNELAECARYDEVDNVLEILSYQGIEIDRCDNFGSSALHKAAANGNTEIVKILIEHGAKIFQNSAGNTPLHWALQTRKKDTCLLLLAKAEGIDVLLQNGSGKSAISLAYEFNDVDILNSVLAHSTASRLNKDGSVAPVGVKSDLEKEEEMERAGESAQDTEIEQAIISDVTIEKDVQVKIREIGWIRVEHDDLQKDLETTGGFMWAASLILARWICTMRESFAEKKVVELGGGCGLPSITAFKATTAAHVWLTDMKSNTFENSKMNIDINSNGDSRLAFAEIDWCDKTSWPTDLVGQCDILIGSDLVYDKELVAPLINTITSLVGSHGVFYYVTANESRAGCKEFIEMLKKTADSHTVTTALPENFVANPFSDDSSFALRFPELTNGTTFTMCSFTFNKV